MVVARAGEAWRRREGVRACSCSWSKGLVGLLVPSREPVSVHRTFSERTPSRTAAGRRLRFVCSMAWATRWPPNAQGAPSGAVRKIRREYRCPPPSWPSSCRKLRSTLTFRPATMKARVSSTGPHMCMVAHAHGSTDRRGVPARRSCRTLVRCSSCTKLSR